MEIGTSNISANFPWVASGAANLRGSSITRLTNSIAIQIATSSLLSNSFLSFVFKYLARFSTVKKTIINSCITLQRNEIKNFFSIIKIVHKIA